MGHKVGDTVTVTRGPHKGDAHKVIHVHKDGRVNVKPHNKMPHQIKYRHGAATAKPGEVKRMSEALSIKDVEKATAMAKKRQEKERKTTGRTNVSVTDLGARMKKKDEGTIITKPGFKMKPDDKDKLKKIADLMKRANEACWDSHKQVGFKMKGGKRVPNCVPKNENQNAALQKKLAKSAQSSEKGKKAVTLKKAPFKIPSKDDMQNEVLDKDKDHMSYRNKAKSSMDRARNSATAKIVRGDDGVDKEKNTMRKRAAGMAMSDRKGVRQFRKFHGYDKKK